MFPHQLCTSNPFPSAHHVLTPCSIVAIAICNSRNVLTITNPAANITYVCVGHEHATVIALASVFLWIVHVVTPIGTSNAFFVADNSF